MPELIATYTRIEAAGAPPKIIEEAVGHANTGEDRLSVALMTAPAGWSEPSQTPDFDEWTVVTEGSMDVIHDDGTLTVEAGQTVLVKAGERIQYSTPNGAKYMAVCLPAFHPTTVNRDAE